MVCSVQIKVSPDVKTELDNLKEYERETYCDVITKLINKEIERENGLEELRQL